MAKKREMSIEKLRRIQARTRVIVFCRRLMVMAFGLAAGFWLVALALPQKRVLDDLEAALDEATQREQAVADEKQNFEIELRALREDPAFLEIHARDRLGYYREGERILKFGE